MIQFALSEQRHGLLEISVTANGLWIETKSRKLAKMTGRIIARSFLLLIIDIG